MRHTSGIASRCIRRTLPFLLLACGIGAPGARAAGPPTITGISPDSGPVGSIVVIEGTNFVPPLNIAFGGNVQAAGSFTATSISVTVPSGAVDGPIQVTTASGTAVSAQSFDVGTAKIPRVTLEATVPEVMLGSGKVGEFTIKLSETRGSATVVNFKIVGSAINGTDYQMLLDSAKVKAGKKQKVIQVVPKGMLGGAMQKIIRLTLMPGKDYTVGSPDTAKVKIVAGN